MYSPRKNDNLLTFFIGQTLRNPVFLLFYYAVYGLSFYFQFEQSPYTEKENSKKHFYRRKSYNSVNFFS